MGYKIELESYNNKPYPSNKQYLLENLGSILMCTVFDA